MISLLFKTILTYFIVISFLEYYEAADSPFNSDNNKSNEKSGRNGVVPRIQIRAILVRCPRKDSNDNFKSIRNTNKNISSVRSEDILQFGGYDKDELLINSEVKDCRNKLFITMKLNNCGRTMSEEEFIVVDHVYDPLVRKRSRLLNPLVFKLRQEQVLQLYGLTFIHMVNSEAKEEVLNKKLDNFTGCDTVSSKPTCGLSYIKDKVIPFSEGFCCSCDSYVNMKRQPSNRAKEVSNIGFSAGQLGVPIKGLGVRSARSSEEEQEEENIGFSSQEFLGKGLWGDLFDSGFQEVKSYKVPRSVKDTDKGEKQRSYENKDDSTKMKEPIYNDTVVNIFPKNDSKVENKAKFNNMYEISDVMKDAASNNITNNHYNSVSDFEGDNVLSFGQEPYGSIGKEIYKPWLLRNDNTFDTFFKRLKVKDKKPTKTSSNIIDIPPVHMNVKNDGIPPLEIAKGFIKSDYKSDRNIPCPWDIRYPNKQVESFSNKKYKNDYRKYMHILSKLLEQGIDLKNDLNLAPEDILERCKEPEKGSQFIRTVIKEAERKLKNKNTVGDFINSPDYNVRYNHYRFRRAKHNNDRIMKLNRIIDNNLPVLANNEDEEIDNNTGAEYFLDIEWNNYKNLTGDDSNSIIFNNSLILKQELKQNLSGIAEKQTNDKNSNNNNIDIIWVESLDYDGNTSESSINTGHNELKNYSSNEEKHDITYKDRSVVENEISDNHAKTTTSYSNFTAFIDDAPINDLLPRNFNDGFITNSMHDLNPELLKDRWDDLFGNNEINDLSKMVETDYNFPEIIELKNFSHSRNDSRADTVVNEEIINPKQYEFDDKGLSELIEGKDVYLNRDVPINNECTLGGFQLENNRSQNSVQLNYFQDKQSQNISPEIKFRSYCSGREVKQNFITNSVTEKPVYPEIISLINKEQHFMGPHTLIYHGPSYKKLKGCTENSVIIKNDFDTLNNLSNHLQGDSTEIFKTSTKNDSGGNQLTDSFIEFDVIIDKNSDKLNNFEVLKNYNLEGCSENSFTITNDFATLNNLSNNIQGDSTEVFKSSTKNDSSNQLTDSFTEFDVIIDKLSDEFNNFEVLKNYNSQLIDDENFTAIERPIQIHRNPDLCHTNNNECKNFTVNNATIKSLANTLHKNYYELLCGSDLFSKINSSNMSKSSQTIKNELLLNLSGYNVEDQDSHLFLDGKQKPQQMEDLNKLKYNYDILNHSTIKKLINDSYYGIHSKQLLSNLNYSNGQKDHNYLLCDRNNIKNMFNTQSSVRSSYNIQNQDYYSGKINNKNWQTNNFRQIELPAVDSKYFRWKIKDDPNSGKENESCFKFGPVKGNEYKNEQEPWCSSFVKPHLKNLDIKNSFVNENDKWKQSFKDIYSRSGEEYNLKNNSSMDYNYIMNTTSEINAETDKDILNIPQKDKILNKSQIMSVILPSNLTKEKGVKIKLLIEVDYKNSSLVSSKNKMNYDVKKLNKRNASKVSNGSEKLFEFVGKSKTSYLDSEHKISSSITNNHAGSFHNRSNITGTSNGIKINNMLNETSYKVSVERELEKTLNLEKDKSKKKSTLSNKIKTKVNKKVKRQILPSGHQYRGGQSCIDRSFPPFADPVTYHESAHCLRFSDLWYNVYRLKRPFVEHSVHIQLYEKHDYQDGRTHWHEITKGMGVNVGTFVRHTHDALPTLAFTYIPFTDQTAGVFCLDPAKTTLLIPQALPPEKGNNPQAEGGPNQYMIVRDTEISFDGEECDKAGVSFEAFARQPDRCAQSRGTCLKNQPVDMWRADMEAKRSNRPGKYFLENYASVPRNPFKLNKSRNEEYLALDYMGRFTSAIEVEVRSDLNAIVRTGASGQMTEIHVDATSESHTRITVIVTNLGLSSSSYYPRLTNCPVEVPEAWTRNEGPLINISPQHRYVFKISLYGTLPIDRFHCSMELLNEKRELVATRRIRVQRHDRCLCQWHCLCACTGSILGMACEPMSLEHYHAAGFQGSLPVLTSASDPPNDSFMWHVSNVLVLYLFSLVFILLLGLLKAILGLCCCSGIGSWGLWLIFPNRSKYLTIYKEPNISAHNVTKDCAGYAIHPIHRTRNVRILSKTGEFCINFIFFVVASLAIIFKLIKICCKCLDAGVKKKTKKSTDLEKEDEDDTLSEESKKEKSMKAKKRQIMGRELSETESWSLPSDLEFDLDNDDDDLDTEYVLQERDASKKNLQESIQRSRGGADSVDSLRYFLDHVKEPSLEDYSKVQKEIESDDHRKVQQDFNQRQDFNELEKKMPDCFADTLQDAGIVYRNFKLPMGGVNLHPGFIYSVKGYFTKIDNSYNFRPTQPLLQYWKTEDTPIIPPLTLDINVFEVTYPTATDVLHAANELSLQPRGLVVNVRYSLDYGATNSEV